MKRTHLPALVAALLVLTCATPARATDEVVAQWTCGERTRPTQREVADWLGIANFDQAYELRARTHHALQRACKGGARAVDLVLRRDARGRFVDAIAQQ